MIEVELISEPELRELMDGHPPPRDPVQRAAYASVFRKRLFRAYELGPGLLLAGALPSPYWEFALDKPEGPGNGT